MQNRMDIFFSPENLSVDDKLQTKSQVCWRSWFSYRTYSESIIDLKDKTDDHSFQNTHKISLQQNTILWICLPTEEGHLTKY